MKKFSALLSFVLIIGVLAGSFSAFAVEYGAENNPNDKTYTQTFSDVPINHWAFQYIEELTDRKAINGYPDGKFYPDKTVTRDEFAKIMVVAAGLTATPATVSSYVDIPLTYWASPFIETAKPYMTAYQSATGLAFRPTSGALREDIAVAVVKLKGYDTRLADLSMLSTMFSDIGAISGNAQPYVALAVENGIISGYNDGTFRGQNTITRAEAAAILWRAFQYGSDTKVIPGDTTTPTVAPTPNPSVALTPTSGPEETTKDYTMDTVAENVKDLRSLVITNDGTVFYATGTAVYNSKSDTVINLSSDLNYELDHDDKNRAFGIKTYPSLAYDSYHDKVYLLGNDPSHRAVIYDITAPDKPEMRFSQDNSSDILTSLEMAPAYESIAYQVKILPNGNLILSDSGGSCYSVNPNTASAMKEYGYGHYKDGYGVYTYLVGTSLVKGSHDSMYVEDPISGTKELVSVEGGFPDQNANNIFAGTDMLYRWDKSVGLQAWDLEGWRHTIIPVDEIEVVDYKTLPSNVWALAVNSSGTCAIYDNTQHSIRLLQQK